MFLIDGYNLLHSVTRGKSGEDARKGLISLVHSWCERGGYRARIVFDPTGGMKRTEVRGAIEIRNVPQGGTADEEILAALESSDDRTQYTVVSNDAALVKAAGKKGFPVVPCEAFAAMISKRAEGPEKADAASPGEVDYWMKEFGLEDDA
ncbi:MAG TPA: NYN domain-containing protein [Planctomycetota bacterium]|nr:NYN domain-containing protein [Planctomycetota bacterium]